MQNHQKLVESQLSSLRAIAATLDASKIAEYVLGNPQFALWTGSLDNKHHYGQGGLLRHTHEVVKLCLSTRQFFAGLYDIPEKELFLAALFHDIGKIYDYEPADATALARVEVWKEQGYDDVNFLIWRSASHKRMIHHISASAIFWSKSVERTNTCRDIENNVTHAILAHHGARAWGSPVAPKSRVAWLLHLCDNISARLNDCDRTDYLKDEKKA